MCFKPEKHLSDREELLRSGKQRSDMTEDERVRQLEIDVVKAEQK